MSFVTHESLCNRSHCAAVAIVLFVTVLLVIVSECVLSLSHVLPG